MLLEEEVANAHQERCHVLIFLLGVGRKPGSTAQGYYNAIQCTAASSTGMNLPD